jgi:hypothetical protein
VHSDGDVESLVKFHSPSARPTQRPVHAVLGVFRFHRITDCHSYFVSGSCSCLLLVVLKKLRNSFATISGLPPLSAAVCPSA